MKLKKILEENPIIAAVKDENGLDIACKNEDINIIFILYGNICNIGDIVSRIKESNKLALVHTDLISGLASRDIAVRFIKEQIGADGIITTKPSLIAEANKVGIHSILRVFILDSMAYKNITVELQQAMPEALEILPGLMPKVIEKISKTNHVPLIAGGLISEKEDINAALTAGAISVSSTNPKVWEM